MFFEICILQRRSQKSQMGSQNASDIPAMSCVVHAGENALGYQIRKKSPLSIFVQGNFIYSLYGTQSVPIAFFCDQKKSFLFVIFFRFLIHTARPEVGMASVLGYCVLSYGVQNGGKFHASIAGRLWQSNTLYFPLWCIIEVFRIVVYSDCWLACIYFPFLFPKEMTIQRSEEVAVAARTIIIISLLHSSFY